MANLNDFNNLADCYRQTSAKPDKLYSTLPTMLLLAGDLAKKVVLDLGCGGGFFADAFARHGAAQVVGLDNSVEQIALAKKDSSPLVAYRVADIFTDALPPADIVLAPYVVNYATDTDQLLRLFQSIYTSLSADGQLIAVVDLPEGKDLKKFGAIKTIRGEKKDGAAITIELYNGEQPICSLSAVYFTPVTVETVLRQAGFGEIQWHKPIIAQAGFETYGREFWATYTDAPELGYVTATKCV